MKTRIWIIIGVVLFLLINVVGLMASGVLAKPPSPGQPTPDANRPTDTPTPFQPATTTRPAPDGTLVFTPAAPSTAVPKVPLTPISSPTKTAVLTSTATLPPKVSPSPTSGFPPVLPQNLLQSPGKLQEDFEDAQAWSKISGKDLPSTVLERQNGQGAMRLAGETGRVVVERQVNWDLAQSDCIRLWVDQPKRGSGVFEILFSTRTDFSRYFSKEVKPNPIGWTLVQICAGEFANTGGATWKEPIIRIRLRVNHNDEFYFDALYTHVSPLPVLMINFDDANQSDYTIAYPILKRLGLVATSYIPTSLVNTPGHLSVAQLLELQTAGWVIGNHTTGHTLLRDLSDAEQQNEIVNALLTLEGWGIRGGYHLAYPVGKYNLITLSVLNRLGMLSGRTVSNASDVFPQINPYILRNTQDMSGFSLEDAKHMIDDTLARRGILTLLFHELKEEGPPGSPGWNRANFDVLMAYIAEKKIPVITVAQYIALVHGEVKIQRTAP